MSLCSPIKLADSDVYVPLVGVNAFQSISVHWSTEVLRVHRRLSQKPFTQGSWVTSIVRQSGPTTCVNYLRLDQVGLATSAGVARTDATSGLLSPSIVATSDLVHAAPTLATLAWGRFRRRQISQSQVIRRYWTPALNICGFSAATSQRISDKADTSHLGVERMS